MNFPAPNCRRRTLLVVAGNGQIVEVKHLFVQHEQICILTIIVKFLTNRRSDISTNSKRNACGRPPSKPENSL